MKEVRMAYRHASPSDLEGSRKSPGCNGLGNTVQVILLPWLLLAEGENVPSRRESVV